MNRRRFLAGLGVLAAGPFTLRLRGKEHHEPVLAGMMEAERDGIRKGVQAVKEGRVKPWIEPPPKPYYIVQHPIVLMDATTGAATPITLIYTRIDA